MADKKYSKIIKIQKRSFRYNYEDAVLEWVFNGEVVDSIGLSRKGFETAGESYCQEYYNDIEEETWYLAQDFKKEMEQYTKK